MKVYLPVPFVEESTLPRFKECSCGNTQFQIVLGEARLFYSSNLKEHCVDISAGSSIWYCTACEKIVKEIT